MHPTPSTHTTHPPEPPSCVQFSPQDPTLVTLGTYFLNASAADLSSKKTGHLCLYSVTPDEGFTLLQSHPTQAILDLKFSPHSPDTLALAHSLGQVSVWTLSERALTLKALFTPFPEDVLVLSLTFSPTSRDTLAVTLSTGEVATVSLESGEVVERWAPHTLEAWTCVFTPDGRGVYSGADDSVVCLWDVAGGSEAWRDRRSHGAGVTAVLPVGGEGAVLTGSYDEGLRAFEVRGGRRGVVGEVRVEGGGVWRLAWMGEGQKRVLASCMHAGTRVVDVEGLEVVAGWVEGESMNYGSDVTADGRVVSCSFYDKRLSLWSA
ncbi:uncharacterized protein H6S33_012918 [Morchella sextelata]|uniref:uncharacterized protein n=1 Tax=Morchella sextelata TaxID=1174677 RepID=UPI001D04938A|nr:uncharacterized protein H6S33_012918 [Morchella sextelata]KAH0609432.1 hypothetical protein H6S33_012918 [Morchella sextelata]